MPALIAVHDVDPRKEIAKKLGPQLKSLNLFGNAILVAIYLRPKEAQYGTLKLQLTDNTRKEDEYQGKVGLIIKMGPRAYVDGDDVQFDGHVCKVGDWVVFRPSDGWQLTLTGNQIPCRILREASIVMKIDSPDAVW